MIIDEIKAELEAARSYAQSIANTAGRAECYEAGEKVRELQKKLSDTIATGAKPLNGVIPIGIIVQFTFRGSVQDGYEVGVTTERAQAFGVTPEAAVAKWNEGVDAVAAGQEPKTWSGRPEKGGIRA